MDIEYNYRGLLTTFFRHQISFWLIFFLVAGAGILKIMTTQPVYEAHGSFLVKFGQNARPSVSMSNSQPSEMSSSDRSEIVQSNILILRSQDLLREVINAVGVQRLYPEMAQGNKNQYSPVELALKKLLEKDLQVKSATGSNVIEISLKNTNPQVGASFVNVLMDCFAARQAEVFNTPQLEFLDQQAAEAQRRLEESQQKLQAFKKTVGISSIDAEMDQLRKEKGDLTSIAYQAVTEAQVNLARLESKSVELSATYSALSPVAQRARESVATAQKQLESRQADLNARTGTSSLAQKIGKIDSRISYLEIQRGKLNELEQKQRMDEDNYKYYRQRSEEARANSILDQQNITRIAVVDKAVAETKPVSPKKSMILAIAVLGGLLLGLGTVLVRELMDDSITTPAHVTASLGVPVLAAFGKVRRK